MSSRRDGPQMLFQTNRRGLLHLSLKKISLESHFTKLVRNRQRLRLGGIFLYGYGQLFRTFLLAMHMFAPPQSDKRSRKASEKCNKILIDVLKPFGSQKPPKIDTRALTKLIENQLKHQLILDWIFSHFINCFSYLFQVPDPRSECYLQ